MSSHALRFTGNPPLLREQDHHNLHYDTERLSVTDTARAGSRRSHPPVTHSTVEPHYGPPLVPQVSKGLHHAAITRPPVPLAADGPHYGPSLTSLDTEAPHYVGIWRPVQATEECSVSEGAHYPDGTEYPTTKPHPIAGLGGEGSSGAMASVGAGDQAGMLDMSSMELGVGFSDTVQTAGIPAQLPGKRAGGRGDEEGVVRGGARKRRRKSSEEAVAVHSKMLRELEPAESQDSRENETVKVDVGRMSSEEMERLQKVLGEAEEVAMTVLYSDGDTQVTTRPDVRTS